MLETNRLILRRWAETDRQPMAAIQGDPDVRRYFYQVATPDQVDADIDLAMERWAEGGFHYFAAELKTSGKLIGLIGIGLVPDITRAAIPSHPAVEIGWVLGQEYWGQGLAIEGAKASLAYGWTLGIAKIVAFTSRLNLPSQRVMQKLEMSYDPSDDYLNPQIPVGHRLSPHVVYKIKNPDS
jgi:RimJ/RimL family protein N-acetyltransferase